MIALTLTIENPIAFVIGGLVAWIVGSFLGGAIENWFANRNPTNYWRDAYTREIDRQSKLLTEQRCPTCSTPFADWPDPDPNERLDIS